VSDIEAEKERFAASFGAATAALFSLPWLWSFTLLRLHEISETVLAMARRRRIATLVLVLGLLASGATLSFGSVQYWRASRLLSALQARCESERDVFWKSSAEEPILPPEAIPASQYKEKPGTKVSPKGTGFVPPGNGEIDPSELPPDFVKGPLGPVTPPAVTGTTPPPVEYDPADLDPLMAAGLQCVPKDIEDHSAYLEGYHAEGTPPLLEIQRKIHEQVRARERDWNDAKSWAPLVALIPAIPWGWYFLLGRIEELIAVIRGTGE